MFYRIKYSILWLLIVTLTLSEASNRIIASRKDGVCDEDCMLSKSNIHGKNKSIKFKPRSNPQTRTCSIQGIDTSASSEEPFQLFDISNQQYNIAYLTQPGGICECSSNVKEAKHAVIKKELDGRIVLTDAYILCGEDQNNEQILEELMFDYIKNIPERTLGSKPNIKKDDEYCLDENGFITTSLPGSIPCFSYISVFSNETYSSTNQLIDGSVNYYSGPFSVNRINQTEYFQNPNDPGKNFSMLALFYERGHTCNISELNTVTDNHCHLYFNSEIYSIICCCKNEPGQCAFRKYQDDKLLVCANGGYVMDLMDPGNNMAGVPKKVNVKSLKEKIANKAFCSSQYTFDNASISYEMPARKIRKCNAGEESKGYCILDNDVCPSDVPNPSKTTITCCCRKDLCNVDFFALHAVDRFQFMIENKVCEQPMLYSILFALTNYTLFGDHKQPLCYIHYDVNQPTARYFLPNNNLDLLRDIDYQAYRKEGCNVIAVKIRSIVVDHKKCPGEKYTVDDTKLPRPLLVCTCNGTKIDTITTKETKFCDEELRKNIGSKYNEIKDKLMPKCLVTKCPVKNFDENVSFNAVLENASIDMTTKSIFCYMELVKDSENINENEIHNFSLSAGIASLENGYGEKCFNLYSETEGKGVSDEKPFCGLVNDEKILCCIIGMGKEGNELPIQLLDEITEKVVEQRVIRNPALIKKLYQNQKSLKCRTSKITREFGYGNVCKYPHGCFWTDSSIGEVKTTYVAGCIDIIPKLLEQNSSNPIFRALQTCVTISKQRRLIKLDEKEKKKEPFRCFATNEINYADSNDKNQLTNVFIVCCCTEIDENGRCDKKDRTKKSYGAKVIDVANNQISKQHKNQIYSVPF